MSAQPNQEWRILMGRPGLEGSGIYLNGEKFRGVLEMTLSLQEHHPPQLTLTLAPHRVTVVPHPTLHLIVNQRHFRVIEDTVTGDVDHG